VRRVPGFSAAVKLPPVTRGVLFTIGSKDVTVDGQVYQLDVAPYIDAQGRTMVPVRYVGELLGCSVVWEPDTRTVVLTGEGVVVSLEIGSRELSITQGSNTRTVSMDTEAVIVPPVRFVAEAFDYAVGWNGATKGVTLSPPAPTSSSGSANSGITTSPASQTTSPSSTSTTPTSSAPSGGGGGGGGGGSGSGAPSTPAAPPTVTAATISVGGVPFSAQGSPTSATVILTGSKGAVVSDPTISVTEPCVLTITGPAILASITQPQQLNAGQNTWDALNQVLQATGSQATLGELYDFVHAATGGDSFTLAGTLSNSSGTTPISLTVVVNVTP